VSVFSDAVLLQVVWNLINTEAHLEKLGLEFVGEVFEEIWGFLFLSDGAFD
jgi:hypothetical protein